MKVSIHQPNYLPWIGFINKILRSDIYVIFDDVQFPRGKDFAYRNKIKTGNGELWLSVPIKNRNEMIPWNGALIDNQSNWNKKHLRSIELNYKKSVFFLDYFPYINSILSESHEKLITLNTSIIRYLLEVFNWRGEILNSSDLNVEGTGNKKIIGILEKLNATEYISGEGTGSNRYIIEEDFAEKGIKLIWQNFAHPVYTQLNGNFVPYLSVIDLLFNCGESVSREIILNHHIL